MGQILASVFGSASTQKAAAKNNVYIPPLFPPPLKMQ